MFGPRSVKNELVDCIEESTQQQKKKKNARIRHGVIQTRNTKTHTQAKPHILAYIKMKSYSIFVCPTTHGIYQPSLDVHTFICHLWIYKYTVLMNAYKNGYIVNERAPFFYFYSLSGVPNMRKNTQENKHHSYFFMRVRVYVLVRSSARRGFVARSPKCWNHIRGEFFFFVLSLLFIFYLSPLLFSQLFVSRLCFVRCIVLCTRAIEREGHWNHLFSDGPSPSHIKRELVLRTHKHAFQSL